MASSKSEIELSPLPTKDEADGKPEEENAVDDVIQSQLARIKHFQSIVAHGLIWLRIIAICGIGLGIVFIVIHNMLTSNEKDVPADVIKNLYEKNLIYNQESIRCWRHNLVSILAQSHSNGQR